MNKMLSKLRNKLTAGSVVLALAASAQAPQVTLTTLDGRAVNLAEQRGKLLVLSFGATWVPLASKELPALQKLADRYAERGVQVYWVSVNSAKAGAKNFASDEELQAFAEKRGLRASVLRDPEQAAYRAFGVDALPTVVILDRQGKLVRKHVGFDPDQGEAYGAVIKELDALLK
jgi:peroxiredoxin